MRYPMRATHALSRQILRSWQASASVRTVRPKAVREYFAKIAKQGGQARARKLTPEQRKASARKAAQARWAKERKAQNG